MLKCKLWIMPGLIEQMRAINDEFGLFDKNDRVLIALSGGPDSVALFHLMDLIADEYELTIAAAHVNHMLRRAAEIDRKFCRELCRVHSRKFHSIKVDISSLAKRRKKGIEETARDYRYRYFKKVCEKYGYTKVATGHTADDSAETFILNLIRGAELGGLTGIPPKRGEIIRPLIAISRAQIMDFLKEYKLSFRIDQSNLDIAFTRNLVRNKIFPSMRKANNRAIDHIAETSLNLRKLYELLELETEKAYGNCLTYEAKRQITLDLKKLPAYHKSLKSWILLRAYRHLTGEMKRPGRHKIEEVLSLSREGSVAFLGNDVIASNQDGKLVLSRLSRPIRRIKISKNSLNKLPGWGLIIKVTDSEEFNLQEIKTNKDEGVAFLDYAKVGELSVRSIKEGDKFKPLGMVGTKKLADYLNEKGVPFINKKAVPVVLSDGDIAWVAGCGIADKFKVTGNTRIVLKLELIGVEE